MNATIIEEEKLATKELISAEIDTNLEFLPNVKSAPKWFGDNTEPNEILPAQIFVDNA